MSKKNREKGKRQEYSLRNHFRSLGYTAHRVPSSGAAQGFKGDVEFSDSRGTYTAELKSRKDEFKRIFALYDKYGPDLDICIPGPAIQGEGPVFISMSYDLNKLMHRTNVLYVYTDYVEGMSKETRTLQKLKNMRKLVKGCDVLVLHQNYKPFLFIRYGAL